MVRLKKGFVRYAAVVLMLAACGEAPAFSPAPESYTETRVAIEGRSEERIIASVDSTFFGRNRPMLGRDFVSQEYGGESSVAILSHAFWVEEYGERPEIIGSSLEVGGVVRTIVGIMPRGVDVPANVALWIPRDGS